MSAWLQHDFSNRLAELISQAWSPNEKKRQEPHCEPDPAKEVRVLALWWERLKPDSSTVSCQGDPLRQRSNAFVRNERSHILAMTPHSSTGEALISSDMKWFCRDDIPLDSAAWSWLLMNAVGPLVSKTLEQQGQFVPSDLLQSLGTAWNSVTLRPPRAYSTWVVLEFSRLACKACLPHDRWNSAALLLASLKSLGDEVMAKLNIHLPVRGSAFDCTAAQQQINGVPGMGSAELAPQEEAAAIRDIKPPTPCDATLLWQALHPLPAWADSGAEWPLKTKAKLASSMRVIARRLIATTMPQGSSPSESEALCFVADTVARRLNERFRGLIRNETIIRAWQRRGPTFWANWQPPARTLFQVRLGGQSEWHDAEACQTERAGAWVRLTQTGRCARYAATGRCYQCWKRCETDQASGNFDQRVKPTQLKHDALVFVTPAGQRNVILRGRVKHLGETSIDPFATYVRIFEKSEKGDGEVERPALLWDENVSDLLFTEARPRIFQCNCSPSCSTLEEHALNAENLAFDQHLKEALSWPCGKRHLQDKEKRAAEGALRTLKRMRFSPADSEIEALAGLTHSFHEEYMAREARLRRRKDAPPPKAAPRQPAEHADLCTKLPSCKIPGCSGILNLVPDQERLGADEKMGEALQCSVCRAWFKIKG